MGLENGATMSRTRSRAFVGGDEGEALMAARDGRVEKRAPEIKSTSRPTKDKAPSSKAPPPGDQAEIDRQVKIARDLRARFSRTLKALGPD